MTRTQSFLATLLLAGGSTLALAGCKLDNRPLLARGAPAAPDAYAAAPNYDQALAGLPTAPPAPVAYVQPDDAYYYPERAYSFERAAYRQAPDYGFRYGDVEPWAWADDDGMMFAEPIDDGYRYYYYEPGDAYPYYVRDDQYGYAYGDDGVLLALFNAAGALLAPDTYGQYAPVAGRYWRHAYDLNRGYYDAPRYRVQTTVWEQRAPTFYADQQRWFSVAEQQPTWRAYRERRDNGLHLGWDKAKPRPVNYAPAGPAHADRQPDWRAPRPDQGPKDRGPHGGPAWKAARGDHGARPAEDFGRQASARVPDRAWGSDRPDRGPKAEHGGHGRDKARAEHGPMQMAQATPQPNGGGDRGSGPAHGPKGGGGPDRGDHGQGHGPGGGGGDHGGGDKGHGGGGDKGHGGGHGKGK